MPQRHPRATLRVLDDALRCRGPEPLQRAAAVRQTVGRQRGAGAGGLLVELPGDDAGVERLGDSDELQRLAV